MAASEIVVPRSFIEDFELVAEYSKLREVGEYELVKQIARDDIENAIPCFADIANWIRSVRS